MTRLADLLRTTRHLTVEQLYDALDERFEQSKHKHLHGCAQCRSEVNTLRETLTDFREAIHNYADAQILRAPAAEVRRRNMARAPFHQSVWAFPLATAASVAVLALAILHPHRAPVAPAAPTVQGSQASTSADEALLDGIDRDLSTSIPPSLKPLAVPVSTTLIATKN